MNTTLVKYLGIALILSVLSGVTLYYRGEAGKSQRDLAVANAALLSTQNIIVSMDAEAKKVETVIEYRDKLVERIVERNVYREQKVNVALDEAPDWASTLVPAGVLASLLYAASTSESSKAESAQDAVEEVPDTKF